jgi:hypothetical protein
MLRGPSRPALAVTCSVRRVVRVGVACVLAAAVVAFVLALAVAGADSATASGGPTALPDGRVYEQASSQKKNGNEAGVGLSGRTAEGAYGQASPDGDAVVYTQEGPSGETSSGVQSFAVSSRSAQAGWEVRGALPPPDRTTGFDLLGLAPLAFLASADLTHFVFGAGGPFVSENSKSAGDANVGLYRTRGNFVEPEWISRPTLPFSQAKPEPGTIEEGFVYPVGGSANLSSAYFTYAGTLVPEDKSRAPFVQPRAWNAGVEYSPNEIVEEGAKRYKSIKGETVKCVKTVFQVFERFKTEAECLANEGREEGEWERQEEKNQGRKPSATLGEWWNETPASGAGSLGPWGFYEWHEGVLRSAGELPGGGYSPYGAVPAVTQNATGNNQRTPFPRLLQNEVSQDGSKAFFVSPETLHASEAGKASELYVREQTPSGPRTLLVSRDELSGGSEAPAPECTKGASFSACAETAVTPVRTGSKSEAYVYASPDGSRAFFESRDKLAKNAAGTVEPEGSGPWTYEFNLNTKKVTLLPGVIGPIASSSQDGSSFIFNNTEQSKLELWSGGPGAVEIASFSTPAKPEFEGAGAKNGAVFVFNTNAVLERGSQTFNDSAALLQAYRYDVSSQRLSCVSCAPNGVTQQAIEHGNGQRGQGREIADEGSRVFFATATKLVPAAENGVSDVYEWEQAGTGSCQSEEREGGCIYLLSSGTSPDPSFYLDNDESGENVFFVTRAGLVKGDTDDSYDVYDARVNGGFPEPPPPAECGGTCRSAGPGPVLPESLTSALGPSGNLIPTLPPPAIETHGRSETGLTRQQKLAKALKACAKKPKRQRAACVKRAEKLYGAKAKAKRSAGSRRGRR